MIGDGTWITPWWQAALLPDSWDVCGMRVPSLSVWHVFALENISNAYLMGGKADRDSAASLLLFASRDYSGGRRLMLSRYYRARQMRKVARRLRKMPQDAIHAACGEYVQTCTRHGHRERQGGGAAIPAGAPEPWAIVVALRCCGDSWATAWNTPYAVGREFLDARDEGNGHTVLTPATYGEHMHDRWEEEYAGLTGTQNVSLN